MPRLPKVRCARLLNSHRRQALLRRRPCRGASVPNLDIVRGVQDVVSFVAGSENTPV